MEYRLDDIFDHFPAALAHAFRNFTEEVLNFVNKVLHAVREIPDSESNELQTELKAVFIVPSFEFRIVVIAFCKRLHNVPEGFADHILDVAENIQNAVSAFIKSVTLRGRCFTDNDTPQAVTSSGLFPSGEYALNGSTLTKYPENVFRHLIAHSGEQINGIGKPSENMLHGSHPAGADHVFPGVQHIAEGGALLRCLVRRPRQPVKIINGIGHVLGQPVSGEAFFKLVKSKFYFFAGSVQRRIYLFAVFLYLGGKGSVSFRNIQKLLLQIISAQV